MDDDEEEKRNRVMCVFCVWIPGRNGWGIKEEEYEGDKVCSKKEKFKVVA